MINSAWFTSNNNSSIDLTRWIYLFHIGSLNNNCVFQYLIYEDFNEFHLKIYINIKLNIWIWLGIIWSFVFWESISRTDISPRTLQEKVLDLIRKQTVSLRWFLWFFKDISEFFSLQFLNFEIHLWQNCSTNSANF